MSDEDRLIEILSTPAELTPLLPMWVVLRKSGDNVISGLCENSFSMSQSLTDVRIWWTNKDYLSTSLENAERNSQPGDIIIDPLSAACPVKVDWHSWLNASTKYSARNAPFVVRDILAIS